MLNRSARVRDLVAEALAGVAARPRRLALTTAGTVLGVGALVTTFGLGQTAGGQIATRFDAVAATQIVVQPRPNGGGPGDASDAAGGVVPSTPLPWDAAARAERLNGVVAAATISKIDLGDHVVRSTPFVDPTAVSAAGLPVYGTSADLLAAARGHLATGRFFDRGHVTRHDAVAVLGAGAARRLHISRLDAQPAVFIGDEPFTVIGIVDALAYHSDALDGVLIPDRSATALGLLTPGELDVRTQLGAAQVVGRQLALALDPARAAGFDVSVPSPPSTIRRDVQGDVNALFVALGGIALLVGALGIANVTLLSVLERIGEIGLRGALGATRRTLATQFLLESMLIGLLGGLLGTAAGVVTVVSVSISRSWTPVLDARLAVVAPLLGALTGLLAGTYPAWRAASIEPALALRGGG